MRMNLGVTGTVMFLALFLVQAQVAESQGAPPDPWYSRSSRPRDFEAPKVLLGKFTLELPRNWPIVAGHGGILFTAAERPRDNRSAAAIVLEQIQLQGTVDAKDVTPALADTEMSLIRDRQPGGQSFERLVKEAEGRRFIFIQYLKPGWTGQDRVVQYSMFAGAVMYRLICIAPAAQIAKYQPLFAHVAASFKAS
jgi:hypothetical protein